MDQPLTSNEAINILKKAGCSPNVIKHCKSVSRLAVKIAREIKKSGSNIDVQLVRIGSLLHDIGRSKTHKIDHAIVGVEIATSFNLSTPLIRIVERHIGSGIPAREAVKLGLPNKDFFPETLEEKIVCYADKLIEGNHEISYEEAVQRFAEDFGKSHPIIRRFQRIHSDLFKSAESIC